ncbi:cupin [Lentibacillus sp. N15]|uniref:cupin n=1 Tax=Lentibacillus songyuanensis TaxID=3136161 RepID=UPI0031BADAE3
MSRPEVEFTHYSNMKAEQIPNSTPGRTQRIISHDPETGDMVRVSEFAPGVDSTNEGVQSHDFWEEVYIIEGSVIDLTLNEEFSEGMVASRPPGMKHGPWKSPNGCKMFEVVYRK